MTATLDAPAAQTDAAVSSVMPPMATTGRPFDRRAASVTCARPYGGVAGVLRARAEHRSDRDVADGLGRRLFDLLTRVRGKPDRPPSGPSRRPDRRRGKIVLAHVHACGPRHQCKVRPVVHDHERRHTAAPAPANLVAQIEETIGGQILGANLDATGAAVQEGTRQLLGCQPARSETRHVDDGVERRVMSSGCIRQAGFLWLWHEPIHEGRAQPAGLKSASFRIF